MFDGGLAAAVDTLTRTAFSAGLVAAELDPPIKDPEAFYCGLIQGIQETDLAMRVGKGRPADVLPPKAGGRRV